MQYSNCILLPAIFFISVFHHFHSIWFHPEAGVVALATAKWHVADLIYGDRVWYLCITLMSLTNYYTIISKILILRFKWLFVWAMKKHIGLIH